MESQDEGAQAVRVRLATLDDLNHIVEFNAAIASETEDLELDRDVLRAGVGAVLADSAKGVYYCAEVDGVVAGQTMITLEWSDWRNAQCWWIQSVYVKEEYRRRGVFKALYEHVRHLAREAGAVGLRLYAYDTNSRAHATYERMGMTSHNIVYEYMF